MIRSYALLRPAQLLHQVECLGSVADEDNLVIGVILDMSQHPTRVSATADIPINPAHLSKTTNLPE